MRMAVLLSIALSCAAFLAAPGAVAQSDGQATDSAASSGDTMVKAKGLGIIGGVVAGAELGAMGVALFKVKPWWAYMIGAGLGAGGGALGGYVVQKRSTGGAIALMVSSMVLVIPTILVVKWGRAYDPADEFIDVVPITEEQFSFESIPSNFGNTTTDVAPADESEDEEDSEGEESSGSSYPPVGYLNELRTPQAPKSRRSDHRRIFGSLLNLSLESGAQFAIPAPVMSISEVTLEEHLMGFKPTMQVHLPLVSIDLP